MEGYGSAIPTRVYALPFPRTTLHGRRAIGYHRPDELNWRFLGFLNVKYVVTANQALYRNAVALPKGGWREAAPADVAIIENPLPHRAPCLFHWAGAGGGRAPVRRYWRFSAAMFSRFAAISIRCCRGLKTGTIPNGTSRTRRLKAWWKANLPGTDYGVDGPIDTIFAGDRIEVKMSPSERRRFLVLNELHHPGWRAVIDGRETPIYATNVYMRGLVVPPGATRVVLRFRPWANSPAAWMIYGLALTLLVGGAIYLRKPAGGNPRVS